MQDGKDNAHTSLEDYKRFVRTLEAIQTDLRAAVAYLMGNSGAVDDVTQETNLVLMKEWERWDPARPMIAWARTVAYYQVMKWLKTASREKVVFDESAVEMLAETLADEHGTEAEFAEARARALESELAALSRRERAILKFRYERGYTLERLGRRYHMSIAAVSLLLARLQHNLGVAIRKRLHEELD